MAISAEEVNRRISEFAEKCRRSGIKVTHQRLEVLREVARTDEHPDVETIYQRVRLRVPSISLDTVYRTLWLLVEQRLISTVGIHHDRVRFDANMQPHHHFVCTQCGLVGDFYNDEFDRFHAAKDVAPWGTVTSVHVELRGICSRCGGQRKEY